MARSAQDGGYNLPASLNALLSQMLVSSRIESGNLANGEGGAGAGAGAFLYILHTR